MSAFEVVSTSEVEVDDRTSLGGDVSLGAEGTVRRTWATGREDIPYVTVDVLFYVQGFPVDEDENRITEYPVDVSGYEELGPDDHCRYSVEQRLDWIGHTDAEDPGSSEVFSDVENVENTDAFWIKTLAIAEATVERRVNNIQWERDFHPENLEVLK